MKVAEIDKDEYLKHFGIKVSKEMMTLEGRVLDPPTLHYKEDESVQPRNGAWDMRGKSFYSGATIEKWGIVVFSSVKYFDERSLRYVSIFLTHYTIVHYREFIYQLQDAGQRKGLVFKDEPIVCYFKYRDSLDDTFREFKRQKLQLVVAIIDKEGSISYSKLNYDKI